MDNFVEQLVVRNETQSEKTRKTALLIIGSLMTVLIALTAFLQLGNPIIAFLGFILAAAAGYFTYFKFRSSYVEYEYAFTNGTLDVDKIVAKSKRYELLSTEVRTFTAFGKYDDSMEEDEDMTVIIVTDNIASHEYYADFLSEEYGKTRLVFAPNERMLGTMKKFLPPKLRSFEITEDN